MKNIHQLFLKLNILPLAFCFSFLTINHLPTKADTLKQYINPVVAIVASGQNLQDSSCSVKLYYFNTKGNNTVLLDSLKSGKNGLSVKMHVRGRSTRNVSKQQFEVELDSIDKKELKPNHFMDMKYGGSHWVFNDAGAFDLTLMRNSLAFITQQEMGQWAPRNKYFELFIIEAPTTDTLNDSTFFKSQLVKVIANPEKYYNGVYLLMEKIKAEKHRIDIKKYDLSKGQTDFILQLNPAESKYKQFANVVLTSQVELYEPKADELAKSKNKGGWDSINNWYANKWVSNHSFIYTTYASVPSCPKLKATKGIYIPCPNDSLDKVPAMEAAFKNMRATTDYNSFAIYFLLNELARDPDGYHRSTFMYQKNEKMYAGPLWDKNKSFGNTNAGGNETGKGCCADTSTTYDYYDTSGWSYCMNELSQSPVWWESLLLDPSFCRVVQNTWKVNRTKKGILVYENLIKKIASVSSHLTKTDAVNRNANKWYPKAYNFASEVEIMETYLKARLEWMDQNLNQLLKDRSGYTSN
jgi:hypothetical protein